MVRFFVGGAALLFTAVGCARPQVTAVVPGAHAHAVQLAAPGRERSPSSSSFDAAMRTSSDHDARGDWRASDCAEVAAQFRAASRLDSTLREALYNASVAELRCRGTGSAQQRQLSSLEMRPRPYEGFVRLTPITSRRSAAELRRALEAAAHANIAATGGPVMLASLAALHVERGYWSADGDEATRDFATAEGYLERALMIDERAAAARTQLALLHLARAQQAGRALRDGSTCARFIPAPAREGGARPERGCVAGANAEELERALGVALQVVREHPTYAPARNAMGLVSYALHDTNEAVRQFVLAASLQPSDVDAYTNLGGALLSTRSFAAAQRAFEAALALRHDAYEGHLGRAAALGAQIDERHWGAQVATVESELAHCKAIAPDRPEAYYNEAWLNLARTQRSSGPLARAAAMQAGALFDTFLAKAGLRPAYSREVQSARAKLGELRDGVLSGR